jgi:hypothetical protein
MQTACSQVAGSSGRSQGIMNDAKVIMMQKTAGDERLSKTSVAVAS